MKYQKHYLSDDSGNNKMCPLQPGLGQCDSYCAWFDHENQDCRMIGGFWKVREGLAEVSDHLKQLDLNIFEGLNALFQKP